MPKSSEEYSTVNDDETLGNFLRVLVEHPWLRAMQMLSSTRVEEHETIEGYDARAFFQSDNLASPPLEVQLRGIAELNLRGGGHVRALGSGRVTGDGIELDFDVATVVCESLRYRLMPRGASLPGDEGSVSLH